jgi:hypothetical protein
MDGFWSNSSTFLRIALLTGVLIFGYLEGAVLHRRDWACVTWMTGLAALTAWVAYPFTASRICLGAIVFIAGVSLIVLYYRQSKNR